MSNPKVEAEAHHFLDEARQRDSFQKEFDALPLKEQLAVVRAMKRQEGESEQAHPDLPKVHIVTFGSGALKEVDVPRAALDPRRITSGPDKELYHADKDPVPKSELPAPVKSILHGLGEALRAKRKFEHQIEKKLLEQ